MNTTELIQEIPVKEVDVDRFAQLAIDEEYIRDEIVRQMMTHPHIMVYYHCYYVIKKASQERPELFYQYWHVFVTDPIGRGAMSVIHSWPFFFRMEELINQRCNALFQVRCTLSDFKKDGG